MKKILNNKKGYAFIEMIVAIGLFSFVFLMISSIYLSMVESQRSVVATQDIQESMKFIFEVISKEVRSAQKSDNFCVTYLPTGYTIDGIPKKVFNKAASGTNNLLYFQNKYGECVFYFLRNDASGVSRYVIKRGTLLPTELNVTPDSISLTKLDFYIWDDEVGTFHTGQPYVTMRLDAESRGAKEIHKQRTSLQTTISSRYYE